MTILKKKQKILLILISLLLSFIFIFLSCYEPTKANTIVCSGSFADALKISGYDVKKVPDYMLTFYSDSTKALMMNEQEAYPYTLVQGDIFLPLYLSTIVIVTDTRQTKSTPASWAELLLCDDTIIISKSDFELCVMAIAQGLGSTNEALAFLNKLNKQERLILLDSFADDNDMFSEASIAIITDTDAASLKKSGLWITVPDEGTLSLAWGLCGQNISDFVDDQVLAENGLRCIDGSCDAAFYPQDYSSASRIENIFEYSKNTRDLYARFRREVLNVRKYTTANGKEHLASYLILAFGICMWGFSLFIRIANRRVRRLMLIQTTVLLFWMAIRYLRLILFGSIYLLWYMYYLPLLFSPMLLVFACHETVGRKKYTKQFEHVLLAITSAVLLLILTNTLHQWVLPFQDGYIVNWNDAYTYSFGYYIVAVWMVLLLAYGFTLLFKRAKDAESTRMLLTPLLALGLCAVYIACYDLGVPFAAESEFSFVASVFVCLVWELCIDTGLFQANVQYAELFKKTAVPLWFLDYELKVKQRSGNAGMLPESIQKAIMEGRMQAEETETAMLDALPIHGGYAVWRTDISRIIELRREIQHRGRKLEERNLVLAKETEIQRELASLRHRSMIASELENAMREKVDEIRSLTDSLNSPLTASGKETLIRIKLLVGFCKRISNIMLSGEQHGDIKTAMLGLMIHETAIDASVAGVECNVYYANSGSLATESATVLYSFFEHCMEQLICIPYSVVFVRLIPENNKLILLLIIDIPNDNTSMKNACEGFKNQENSIVETKISSSWQDGSYTIKAQVGGYTDG